MDSAVRLLAREPWRFALTIAPRFIRTRTGGAQACQLAPEPSREARKAPVRLEHPFRICADPPDVPFELLFDRGPRPYRDFGVSESVVPEEPFVEAFRRQLAKAHGRQRQTPMAVDLVILHHEVNMVVGDRHEPSMMRPADLIRLDTARRFGQPRRRLEVAALGHADHLGAYP